MPASKTTTRPRSAKARGVGRWRNLPDRAAEPTYLVCGNRTTHVVVPWEEYRDYLAAKMAADSVRVLDDPRTEWVDADDVARRFAADRIASARRARKLTQKQLGRLLGLPQPQISRIERNPDRTTVRVMKRIAKALGVDVSALI